MTTRNLGVGHHFIAAPFKTVGFPESRKLHIPGLSVPDVKSLNPCELSDAEPKKQWVSIQSGVLAVQSFGLTLLRRGNIADSRKRRGRLSSWASFGYRRSP